jgi:hypothetical protein
MNIFGRSDGKENGAKETEILGAQDIVGVKFPANYRKFISESDGIHFKAQKINILSLKESLEYFKSFREFGITQTWGYFPILDNEDSNPWCLCCKTPISGYIVQLFHDDAAQIKFRSLESFFAAIKASERNDALLLDDLEGDFRTTVHDARDVALGRELLKIPPALGEGDRPDACRFAMWLLGDDQVDEVIPLLDDQDPFIARDTAERLATMQCPKAAEALRANKKSLKEFVAKSAELLRQHDVQAAIENESVIRLTPGNVLLDMKVFYAERKDSDAEQKFIERAKFFVSRK